MPDGPIGEAWILSDRDDHPSRVANGRLKGHTIGQVLEQYPEALSGNPDGSSRRFPLLLKYLDASKMLSVQVHPSDAHPELIPDGETGKTEAWVVLEAEAESRIYAGLQAGVTRGDLRRAMTKGTVEDLLEGFTPKPGDAIFLPAGTVHTLGKGVVVFEVQQNSDVTFRLYDWGRIDPKTGQPRALQVDQALACIDFASRSAGKVTPVKESALCERLFDCAPFRLWRLCGVSPFKVGAEAMPRVLVSIQGTGKIQCADVSYEVREGDVWLLPASLGACIFQPDSGVILLEIALPE